MMLVEAFALVLLMGTCALGTSTVKGNSTSDNTISYKKTSDASTSDASTTEIHWYERGPLYQIYPLSFADSDGNGKGDLRGIIEHVDHLKDLGIEAMWMNPIFTSPLMDNGYDISNFTDINPIFGTMKDLEDLIKALHDNDIKILLDFVPNHSSNEHPWFNDSIHRINGKDDFYVWKDPKGFDANGNPIPPNNWISIFQGSVWEYNEIREQFYLHQFGVYQPDLNFTNPEVTEALKEVMRFWLRKGVDGFRVDAVLFLIENHYELDKPEDPNCATPGMRICQPDIFTRDQEENYAIVKQFDDVFEEDEFKNRSLVNYIEAYTEQNLTLKFYDRQNAPFNFQLLDWLKNESDAFVYENTVQSWLQNMPKGKWPNWVAGNHDNYRIASHHGPEMVDAIHMLLLLLPGLPVTYQGEEIGMTNMLIRADLQIDVSSFFRDPERTPMQWNNSLNAGFTSARRSFLPVNPNYWTINVQKQKDAENSHLKIYKRLVQLHKELIGSSRETLKTHILGTWLFAFERPNHIIVINLNQIPELVNLGNIAGLPEKLYVRIPSMNSAFNDNDVIETKSDFDMTPRSGIVFSFEKHTSSSNIFNVNGVLLLGSLFLGWRQSF